MYDRRAATKSGTLMLRASGRLWREALVMRDRETGTLWTQHDGRALRGRLQGQRLHGLPSERMTFAEAASRHPAALFLEKRPGVLGSGRHDLYGEYAARSDRLGVFGTPYAGPIPGKDEVLVVLVGDGPPLGFPLKALENGPRVAGGAVALAISGGRAFEAAGLEGFRIEGDALLAGDRSWSARTGEALDGGAPLRPLDAHALYAFAFAAAWPDGQFVPDSSP